MAEFKVIETQEQFDEAIGERLRREGETIRKEFEGFLSPEAVQEKYEGYLSPEDAQEKYKNYLPPEQAKEKDDEIKKHQRSLKKIQIAAELGIPYEMAERLSGETDEEMKEDARKIAGFLKVNNPYPDYDPETKSKNSKEEAMKKMIKDMEGE